MCKMQHETALELPLGCASFQEPIIALDIGGSLIKLAYVLPKTKESSKGLVKVHLAAFEVSKIHNMFSYLESQIKGSRNSHKIKVKATGVGALKFHDLIVEQLHAELTVSETELLHASHGVDLLWRVLPKEQLLYNFSSTSKLKHCCPLSESGLGTFALASIGSAFVIAEVDCLNNQKVIHIGGGITAGHTFCGLGRLLTKVTEFSELVQLAKSGNRNKVDLLVKDTASTSYNSFPDDADVSSFGKIATSSDDASKYAECDLAASLLYNICDQIGSTAYLSSYGRHYSSPTSNLKHIMFYGSFLADNPVVQSHLSQKLQTCSQYLQLELQPLFIRFEQYLGVLGLLQDVCGS